MKPSTFWMLALGSALFIADLPTQQPVTGISLMKEAFAVVGRPLTPVSVAGVARRTTRRAIVATSVYVAALPPACTVVVIEGTSLHQCGTTYYQASGAQYVVVNVQ
ncbi:MAG: hypothetical protein U5L05_01375 [Rubrivivax sp.]|nr:hypothetical protein [Rubrivivax sp.]